MHQLMTLHVILAPESFPAKITVEKSVCFVVPLMDEKVVRLGEGSLAPAAVIGLHRWPDLSFSSDHPKVHVRGVDSEHLVTTDSLTTRFTRYSFFSRI